MGENGIAEVLHKTKVRANDSTYYNVRDFIREIKVQDLKKITAGREGEYYPLDLEIEQGQEGLVMEQIREVVDQNRDYDVHFSGSIFKKSGFDWRTCHSVGRNPIIALFYFGLPVRILDLAVYHPFGDSRGLGRCPGVVSPFSE